MSLSAEYLTAEYPPANRRPWARTTFGLLVALLLLPACSTIQPVDSRDPDELRTRLFEGDRLQITRLDGSSTEITLVRIEEDQLVGKAQKISFAEIQSVGLRVNDRANTILVIAGSVILGLLASSVLFTESIKDEFD